MNAAYVSRFEAVFLCEHPKGPKMSHGTAAKYVRRSRSFVQKRVRRYKETKTVDDLPERGSVQKCTKKRRQTNSEHVSEESRDNTASSTSKIERERFTYFL